MATLKKRTLTLKERAQLATLEKRKLRSEIRLKEIEELIEGLDLQINRLKRKGD